MKDRWYKVQQDKPQTKGNNEDLDRHLVGVDPGPSIEAGVDPGPSIEAGLNPGPSIEAGVYPGPGTPAGVYPGSGIPAGVDPGPSIEAGVDPGPRVLYSEAGMTSMHLYCRENLLVGLSCNSRYSLGPVRNYSH